MGTLIVAAKPTNDLENEDSSLRAHWREPQRVRLDRSMACPCARICAGTSAFLLVYRFSKSLIAI